MRPALIRLTKKIQINATSENENFRKLYEDVFDEIQFFRQTYGFTSWGQVAHRQDLVNRINARATEFSEGILHTLLRHKLPTNEIQNDLEKTFLIEYSKSEVSDFNESQNSLVLQCFLTTELFTVIDSIGEILLLAKGDRTTELLNKQLIENVFTFNPWHTYLIHQYKPI